MLSSLARIFKTDPTQMQASDLYITLVSQSRKTFFYQSLQVPDTLDGRHELLVLHLFLVIYRLQENRDANAEFCRLLTETHFSNMDMSLREMGVGDTGVGKRIRKMAEAFFGRMKAYESSLSDRPELVESLTRNVYGTTTPEPANVEKLADYTLKTLEFLKSLKASEIMAKDFAFNPTPAEVA